MVVLGIDTSHPVGSVCVAPGAPHPLSSTLGGPSSHLVEIGRTVDGLLGEARLSPADISRVALVEGPGSFTGLRVGMSYAKGLVAALDVDLVTVGTLELLALACLYPVPGIGPAPGPAENGTTTVAVMVDARKEEVYAAVFGSPPVSTPAGPASLETLVVPCAEAPDAFVRRAKPYDPVYIGSGAIRYRELIENETGPAGRIAGPEAARPSAEYLCHLARDLPPLSPQAVLLLEPRYIRASGAVLKPLKPVEPHE